MNVPDTLEEPGSIKPVANIFCHDIGQTEATIGLTCDNTELYRASKMPSMCEANAQDYEPDVKRACIAIDIDSTVSDSESVIPSHVILNDCGNSVNTNSDSCGGSVYPHPADSPRSSLNDEDDTVDEDEADFNDGDDDDDEDYIKSEPDDDDDDDYVDDFVRRGRPPGRPNRRKQLSVSGAKRGICAGDQRIIDIHPRHAELLSAAKRAAGDNVKNPMSAHLLAAAAVVVADAAETSSAPGGVRATATAAAAPAATTHSLGESDSDIDSASTDIADGGADDSGSGRPCEIQLQPLRGDKDRPYVCPLEGCSKAFRQKAGYIVHERSHRGVKAFACTFVGCDRAFSSKRIQLDHERTHTGERPFACSFVGCGKTFTRKNTLIDHERTHTGEKPYVCSADGCAKAFSRKSTLLVHERSHTGARPFPCTFADCGKAFTSRDGMLTHLRTHTGERPFICEVTGCSKAFAHISTYQRHRRAHLDHRRYKCDVEGCGKAFVCSSGLKEHSAVHEPASIHYCPIENCDRFYWKAASLRKHLRKAHSIRGSAATAATKKGLTNITSASMGNGGAAGHRNLSGNVTNAAASVAGSRSSCSDGSTTNAETTRLYSGVDALVGSQSLAG